MDFAKQIKYYLEKSGLNQSELARKLDVTPSAVSNWASGKIKPRLDKMQQLANTFDIPVSELLGERAAVGSSKLVPLVGYTHMGDTMDEDTYERMVEVPTSVVEAHPEGFCVHADGNCMDNRYPNDSVLMVDPVMTPYNGCAVLAETEGYQSVVRTYSRGTSTLMLSADSHTGEYEDIVVHAADAPVRLRGVVVWYQAEKDVR